MSPFLRTNPIKALPIWLGLGLTLAGCGGQAGTTASPQSSYTTSTPYTDTYYTNPSQSNSGTTGSWTESPYMDTPLPIIGETTSEATASTPVATGVEIQLASKELPGIFSWERCEVQLTAKNHEDTPQQGYLLARFTLKGREVELQYRVLSLSAKGSQTFFLKSTVRADDVSLEYRTKLL